MTPEAAQEESRDGCRSNCAIVAVLLCLLLIGSCALRRWYEPRGHLPRSVELAEVEEWNSDGFFMESCVYGRFRLDRISAKKLRQGGLRFIQQQGPPAKDSERYGEWKEAPLRQSGAPTQNAPVVGASDHLLALGARSCRTSQELDGLEHALGKRGSFYTLTSNLEGLVLIDPQQEKAWFLYSG